MKHPLFVSIPGRFFLALRFVICSILLWGLALPAQAQVVVKERVEITSEGVPVTASASKLKWQRTAPRALTGPVG